MGGILSMSDQKFVTPQICVHDVRDGEEVKSSIVKVERINFNFGSWTESRYNLYEKKE